MFLILLACILTKITKGTSAIDAKELLVEKRDLFVPSFESVAHVLQKGLMEDFQEVHVDVVDCPDLRKPPFLLANAGLSGNPRLVEYGGPGYIRTSLNYCKIYDVVEIPTLVNLESAFIIGAATGCHKLYEANSEVTINVNVEKDKVNQRSRSCKLGETEGSYVQEILSINETRFTFLADYFASEGKPGPVLKVHVRKRIGADNFIEAIIKILKRHYKDKAMGLGGTFLLQDGQVKQHLMPKVFGVPFNSVDDLNNWFRYFTMTAPIAAVGILVTNKYDSYLRDYHFHTFSDHGDCGHYLTDTTPEIAEYLGYFNIAEYEYFIDRPNAKIGLF